LAEIPVADADPAGCFISKELLNLLGLYHGKVF
jgi:hypothetical protein